MKTPEEIKKGLECCDKFLGGGHWNICSKCPYDMGKGRCYGTMMADALAYIQQLEREKKDLLEERELNDFLRDRVKSLESQVPRWIPVEERLPENYATVIIFREDCRNACIGWLIGGSWSVPKGVHVTHWMPLPEAPKEDAKQ